MKALIAFEDKYHLVDATDDGEVQLWDVFQAVNKDIWPGACRPIDWVERYAKIVTFLTDDSKLITPTT